jgi:hypothetical protein
MPDPSSSPATVAARPKLRVLPAPSIDPPFDDEVAAPHRPLQAGPGAAGQDQLLLGFVLPSGLPVEPDTAAVTVLPAPRQPYAREDDDDGPRVTDRAQLPDPRLWGARLAQAVVEVCGGGRPVAQLLRWTSPQVFAELSEQHRPRSRFPRPVAGRPTNVRVLPRQRYDQVRSVHVCEPADGIAEVSVVVAGPQRWWALALRLEGLNGRWVATRLEFV